MQWNVAGLRESLVEAPFGNWLFVKCQGLVLGHGGIPWHWKGVSLSTQVPLVLEASCPLLPLKSMEVGGRSAPHLERENVVLADGFLARREESCAHEGS